MSYTVCPSCKKSHGFESVAEMVNGNPINGWYAIIRCIGCKTAITGQEQIFFTTMLSQILSEIKVLQTKIEGLSHD